MKKRILALLTAAMMLSSVVPAFAEETETVNDGYAEVIVAEDFDYYAGGNKPSISTATAANTIYYNQKYFGSMSGGKGGVFTNMDFGEGADEMVLDIKMALSSSYASEDYMAFKVNTGTPVDADNDSVADDNFGFSGDYVAAAEGFSTGTWENFQIKHYPVTDVEKLKGIVNINMYVHSGSRYSNVYSFQFNKVVTPYQKLLTETITSAKEIKSLGFGLKGADEAVLTYNEGATGTVSIYNDTINGFYQTADYLVDTITLDGTGLQTVDLDRTKYLDYKDLYIKVSDGVELSQIEFGEYEMADQFEAKTEINVTYIGNGDWSADAKAAFEEYNAFPERTFNDTYYDLEGMTDVEYLDFLSNDFADADVILVQAGNRAEGVLDALTYLEAPAKTVVIGNASYASGYGVAAATVDELALFETYQIPQSNIKEDAYAVFNTADSDIKSGVTAESNGVSTNNWSNGDYIVFENARFTHGIKEVKISYAHKTYTGSMKISLDGTNNGTLLADFQNVEKTPTTYGPPYTELTQTAKTSVNGIHDIYAYVYTAQFGNFATLQIVPYDNVTSEVGMNSYNMTAVSENIEFAFDAIHNFDAEDSVTYSVDFGDSYKRYFVINAAAAEGTTGKIIMSDDAGNEIAEFDLTGANGNFNEIGAVSNTALSGVNNVVLTYEGEGSCSIKNVDFSDYNVFTDKLDYTNIAETTGNTNNNYIGGLGSTANYTKWSNVDFDAQGKLWDVTIEYAIPSSYTASDITIYADKVDGPVIAKGVLINQDGMGWENFKTIKVPVTYMPEGVHDVYIKVSKGEYNSGSFALNLKGIQFSEYTGGEKYRVDYRTIAKGTETTPKTVNAVLTFVKDETSPANYIFAAAVYDKTTKQLVDVKTVNGTTVEGLNTASIVYNYTDVAGYEYKYFVWDAATLKPLQAQAFSNEF